MKPLAMITTLIASASWATTITETIADCESLKWTDVKLVKTLDNDGGNSLPYYALELTEVTRDRAAGGIFTESVTTIVQSDSYRDLDSSRWVKNSNGGYELQMDFEGTQPENTSRVALNFTPRKDSPKDYTVTLEKKGNSVYPQPDLEGKTEADSNFAYDRFQERWTSSLVQNLRDQSQGLVCSFRVDPHTLIRNP